MRSMKMILKKISGQISFAANRVGVHRAGGAALSSEGQVGDMMDVEGGNRGKVMSLVTPKASILGGSERKK